MGVKPIKLDRFIKRTITIDDINRAFEKDEELLDLIEEARERVHKELEKYKDSD